MSVFSVAGELILGSRFKRLSDRFLADVSAIYRQQHIPFEPSWFAVFFLLDRYGKMTMGEIAQQLELTQSAITQVVSSLEEKGLVRVVAGKRDKRQKVVEFTDKSSELLKSVKPIWKLIKSKMKNMLDEGENSRFMLEAMDELEAAFKRKSLAERVLDSLNENECVFIKYNKTYYIGLKKLFFGWMFNFGPVDLDFIGNFGSIIRKNSENILLAIKEREVVAAVICYKGSVSKLIVCDRDDVDNRIVVETLSKFLRDFDIDEHCIVYFDADKPLIVELLGKHRFREKRIEERSDVNRKLAVYERMLNV